MEKKNKIRGHDSFIFDLLKNNLPKQEENEEEYQYSNKELILWIIGIIAVFLIIQKIVFS